MAKNPGLRARSQSVRAAMSARSDEAPVSAGNPVSMTIRLDPATHEKLRKLAFDQRRSIHSLLVEGVEEVLAKQK